MDGGVIAGIVCAVIAVLLAVALFICWWRYPHWFFHREKPFNHFIKVEMQPYNQYDENRRVSRVESTASECEEKRSSLRNTGNTNSSRRVGGADVTACPIYASVGTDMDNESNTNGYVNGSQKLHRHGSDIKPVKKGLLQRICVVIIAYVWVEKVKIEGTSFFAVLVKLRVSDNIK